MLDESIEIVDQTTCSSSPHIVRGDNRDRVELAGGVRWHGWARDYRPLSTVPVLNKGEILADGRGVIVAYGPNIISG
jgi:hypothetical protein